MVAWQPAAAGGTAVGREKLVGPNMISRGVGTLCALGSVGLAAVGAMAQGSVMEVPRPATGLVLGVVQDWGPIVASVLAPWVLLALAGRWCRCRSTYFATHYGIEACLGGRCRTVAWSWVQSVHAAAGGVSVQFDDPHSGLESWTIGPDAPGGPEVVEALRQRLGPAVQARPLGPEVLSEVIGGSRLLVWVWRPLREIALPVVLASVASGAAGGLCYGLLLMKLYEGFPDSLLTLTAGGGCKLGLFVSPVAVLLSLPRLARVRPTGFELWGLTAWGARRRWADLRVAVALPDGCCLRTEYETLYCRGGHSAAYRLRQTAEAVLAARALGRLPEQAGEVPPGALSLCEPAAGTAALGLSRVGPERGPDGQAGDENPEGRASAL